MKNVEQLATVGELIELRSRDEGYAVRFPGQSIAFADLSDVTSQYASALYGAGVRYGDHVLLVLNGRAELVYAALGAAKIGSVPVQILAFGPRNSSTSLATVIRKF